MGPRSSVSIVLIIILAAVRMFMITSSAKHTPERSNEQLLFNALKAEVAKCKHFSQSPDYYNYLAEQGHKAAWHGTRSFDEEAYILEAFDEMTKDARASGGETAAQDIQDLKKKILDGDADPKKK